MLSTRLYRLLSKIALFAVIFAALAPSVSHAFASQRGMRIAQEICTSNGRVITIKMMTTKGQQLTTEFKTTQQESAPNTIAHHLNHCPFCANPSVDTAVEAPHTPIIALLSATAQQAAQTQAPVFKVFSPLPPPALAPPTLL